MDCLVIDHMQEYRIGVATTRARPYYTLVTWLRKAGISFDTLEPEWIRTYTGHIVLTTREEAPAQCPVPLMYTDEMEDDTLALAQVLHRCGADSFDGTLVAGVDPGKTMGFSASYAGHEIERSLFVSVPSLAVHIAYMLEWPVPSRRIVRVGDGDMHTAKCLVSELASHNIPSFDLEFVDESSTSPRSRHCNSRGKRDMLAAKTISCMDGAVKLVVAE